MPDKSKKPKRSPRVERALANPSPIGGLDHEAFTYAMHRAHGKSQVASLKAAKPEWDDETVKAQAYLWDRRADIQRAMQQMMATIAVSREEAIIASVEEVLGFLTRGMREPIAGLDDTDPLITEHRITINANGRQETFKKVDPIACAKQIMDFHEVRMGLMKGGKVGDMSQADFINLLRKPGLPEATDGDVIDLESEDVE